MERPRLIQGDCLEVMRGMESASVDAICADPPAGIGFMSREWDHHRGGRTAWVAWLAERMTEAARVVKPGHYALVWALPRTSHWTACAMEDAGWTLVERIAHIFGQGFPKSKARLKPAVEDWWLCRAPGGGKVRELGIDATRVAIVGDIDPTRKHYNQPGNGAVGSGGVYNDGWAGDDSGAVVPHPDSPRHDARGRWPSNICLTHSPACVPAGTRKVKGSKVATVAARSMTMAYHGNGKGTEPRAVYTSPDGTETVAAWICNESCPVRALDAQAGERKSGLLKAGTRRSTGGGYMGNFPEVAALKDYGGDSGCASRFFPTFSFDADDFFPFRYVAKASNRDRGEGNTHNTVKPQMLMRWLCRLATPPGGTILDPFAGSGTTGLAAYSEGFDFIGIEVDGDYVEIARKRLAAVAPTLALADP